MPQRWWIYGDPRTSFYKVIRAFPRVLVTPKVSAHHVVGFADTSWVISNRLVIFALDSWEAFVFLQSSIHEAWSHRPGATTHETRGTYFVDNSIRTFPFSVLDEKPGVLDGIRSVGREYYESRRALMVSRGIGLTTLYNWFHDSSQLDRDIVNLRRLHAALYNQVAASYGWTDLDLAHSFQDSGKGRKFTIGTDIRDVGDVVIHRLMQLNHHRYAEEVAQGLHEKSTSKSRASRRTKEPNAAPLLEGV
jgi:hypothetical protein